MGPHRHALLLSLETRRWGNGESQRRTLRNLTNWRRGDGGGNAKSKRTKQTKRERVEAGWTPPSPFKTETPETLRNGAPKSSTIIQHMKTVVQKTRTQRQENQTQTITDEQERNDGQGGVEILKTRKSGSTTKRHKTQRKQGGRQTQGRNAH